MRDGAPHPEIINPELYIALHVKGILPPLQAQLILNLIYITILLCREAGETMIKDHSTGETVVTCANIPTATILEIHCKGSSCGGSVANQMASSMRGKTHITICRRCTRSDLSLHREAKQNMVMDTSH